MRKSMEVIFLVVICSVLIVKMTFAETVYFDWPITVESYDPYSFGRSLGTVNHSGEDISLQAGTAIQNIADGTLATYKSDGCWIKRLNADYCFNENGIYCGYGVLYGVVQYTLNRDIRVPMGVGAETTNNEFSFVFGHLMKSSDSTQPERNDTEISSGEDIDKTQIIGYVAPNGTAHCGPDDYNGDNIQHLHLGSKPGHVSIIGGYDVDTGYCPAHMVIAASRIGVFEADSTHANPYWNGGDNGMSQAFSNVWWEKNTDGTYKFMDLNNYHNKLGRPNNNHPNAPNAGTDFVHLWESSNDSDYSVYVQDMLQPYESHSRFGDDGKSIIILNDFFTPYKAYALAEGFYGYYKENDGPRTLCMPFTNDIIRQYANGPYILSDDPIQAGDTVTARKFVIAKRVAGGFVYEGRKTLIWKEGIPVQEFGVGEFYINPETCIGVCPQAGDQIYAAIDSNPANDIAWPAAGVTIPTGIWFTKPGSYNFVLHNTDGSRKTGWGMIAVITEGNQQSGGGNGGYVYNRSTICQTVSNGVPLGKSYSFYPEDNYVGIWFELNDVYESLDISWKWYKPNGELYGECEHITDLPSDSFNSLPALFKILTHCLVWTNIKIV